MSLTAFRPSRLYARQTLSPCRPHSSLSPFITGHSLERTFACGGRIMRIPGSPPQGCCGGPRVCRVGLGFNKPSFAMRAGLADTTALHPFRLLRFATMLLSPFGFPHQVRRCPKGIVLNLSHLWWESYERRNGAHLPPPNRTCVFRSHPALQSEPCFQFQRHRITRTSLVQWFQPVSLRHGLAYGFTSADYYGDPVTMRLTPFRPSRICT